MCYLHASNKQGNHYKLVQSIDCVQEVKASQTGSECVDGQMSCDDSGSNVSSSSKVSTRACGKNRPVTLPPKVRYDRYKFWPVWAHAMMRFSPSVGRCRPVYGTNFRDAPNGLIPFNEYESGLQHAFAHDISNRTGCPSCFFFLWIWTGL